MPMMAPTKPMMKPIAQTGIADTYIFERLNRTLNGSPWNQVWLPGRRIVAGRPWRARMTARTLS